MSTKNTNFIGNGSTFVKYFCFLLSGKIFALAIAHGINIPVDQYTFAELLGYIIGFIGATIDAKYHNNIQWDSIKRFLFTDPDEIEDDYQEEIFDNDAPVESDNNDL